MTNPNASFMMETALRNCLQTLLYVSWLLKSKQNKVIITGGRKVDVRHNSNVIYWSVCNKSADFLSGFSMSELIIPAKHNIIVRFILYRLIQKPNCTPKLNDGVSLISLIVMLLIIQKELILFAHGLESLHLTWHWKENLVTQPVCFIQWDVEH